MTYEEWLMVAFAALYCLTFIKNVTVGSDFNFHLWFKYGKAYKQLYREWHDNKPTGEDFQVTTTRRKSPCGG